MKVTPPCHPCELTKEPCRYPTGDGGCVILQTVAELPPLTPDQIARVARLLSPPYNGDW